MSEKAALRFAAAYIRVSTEDQAELSPESQLEEIKKYAQREGIQLLRDQIYIDAGRSGKKADRRPEFMRMIAAAKEKGCPFSLILLWKYSRFARNQEESIFYKSILRSKCGIDVVSVTEPLIGGPFGSLIERIIEWMDEFYSIRLSQEVKRSMKVNAERGRLQAGPSFGYSVENGVLVPKHDEADHVRYIFTSFLSGKSICIISRELNAMGVRTHRGNLFENRTVEYILRNPVYIGKLRWNPAGKTRRDFRNESIIVADGAHEPIISTEIWEKAQHRLDKIKTERAYKARPADELRCWLSGLVRCAACGATLVFAKPHYYKCNNYVHGRCQQSQHIRADVLEDAILLRLKEDSKSSVVCKRIQINSHSGHETERLKSIIRQLKVRRNRLQEAYLADILTLEDFAAEKASIEDSMSEAAMELESILEKQDSNSIGDRIQAAAAQALETLQFPDATVEEKNNAARSVIESCIFDKQNARLSVTYRIVL